MYLGDVYPSILAKSVIGVPSSSAFLKASIMRLSLSVIWVLIGVEWVLPFGSHWELGGY